MTKERIEKAVEIINYAIQNNISAKKASVKLGFADTYFKNTKALVWEEYQNDTIGLELFKLFYNAYEEYLAHQKLKHNNIIIKNQEINVTETNEDKKLSFTVKGNEADFEWVGAVNYPVDHIRTLDQLLKAANVDLNVWNVKDYQVNKWDVTAIVDKQPKTIQNFQVKARLEKMIDVIKAKTAAELFADMIKNYKLPVLNLKKETSYAYEKLVNTRGETNLLEISIFDLHLGKLAWAGETGENYDTKIASKRFLNAIETLLYRASNFQFSRILFPVGNDFFNCDTIFNTTTKGTPQDEDLRWQKTFKVGTKLLVDAINILKQTGVPVDVIVIAGNHDFERSFYMGSFLEAWFDNDEIVTVNNGASPRKYYQFGNVLLGFTHGSEEKESALPLLMATDIESKPMWSDTIYHEWHVGHVHRKKNVTYTVIDDKTRLLTEDLGVTVRYLSSLTGTEEWHHKKGFVGVIKAADGFIWNDETGLIAHLNTNLIIENE